MEKIPAEFLEDAIHNLSEILNELRPVSAAGQTAPSPDLLKKLFRSLHTIKGSAQTFGLNVEGQLAHEMEEFLGALQHGRVLWSADSGNLLTGSLETLVNNFKLISAGEPAVLPAELIQKLRSVSGKTSSGNGKDLPLPENFPMEFSDKLSAPEIGMLGSAWEAGKDILILEFGFSNDDFAAGFKQVREELESAAEVIAVASGAGQTIENTPIFRFLLAAENSAALTRTVREFNAKVLFQRQKTTGQETTGQDEVIDDELRQAILHGKKAAEILGKKVKFTAAENTAQIPPQFSKIAATILLHLVRNAVDHGIEFPLERAALKKPAQGNVEIAVSLTEKYLLISVCDDGRGTQSTPEIFGAGYSTAPFVSELSGRGVGLDIVRDAVQQANGTVKVNSKPGHGTKFEIELPLTEK